MKFSFLGSSPRVRGRVKAQPNIGRQARIIPAGAGKSCHSHRRERLRRDHPRGCGEERKAVAEHDREEGSSPRVRGRVPAVEPLRFLKGIIPAGAGKR